MPSRYSPSEDNYGDNYGDNYDDPRTIQRRRPGRVQEVSDAEIDYIRRRERAAFRDNPERGLILRPQQSQDNDQGNDSDYQLNRRTSRQQRSADDQDQPHPDSGRNNDNGDYQRSNANTNTGYRRSSRDTGGRRSRRRNSSPSSDRESSRAQKNRGGQGQGQQRARSEGRQDDNQGRQGQGQGDDQGRQSGGGVRGPQMNNDQAEQEGKLWYSCKDRKDGTFFERHFDSSYDGLFAAAAGAALGAMTVRRLGTMPGITEEENKANANKKRWKIAAGAVAGAAAVNAGENWFRVYTEDKGDRREHIATGMEFAGECMEAFA